jgi:hypothetical protein
VYVVDDPNYPQNKGTFKVLIFNDKQFYSEFRSKVEKASQTNCVFNGKNAVDCCIHVAEVEEVRNEGQPNEYIFKKKVIDRVTFTTKPYDIPTITKDWVINSGFDEEYYVSSTPEELQRFYNRHYKVSNDDIPEEDMMQVYETKQIKTESTNNIVAVENSNINLNADISDNDLDDLTDNIISSETVEQNSNVETSNNTDAPVESVEDLLAGLDI